MILSSNGTRQLLTADFNHSVK